MIRLFFPNEHSLSFSSLFTLSCPFFSFFQTHHFSNCLLFYKENRRSNKIKSSTFFHQSHNLNNLQETFIFSYSALYSLAYIFFHTALLSPYVYFPHDLNKIKSFSFWNNLPTTSHTYWNILKNVINIIRFRTPAQFSLLFFYLYIPEIWILLQGNHSSTLQIWYIFKWLWHTLTPYHLVFLPGPPGFLSLSLVRLAALKTL